MGQSADVALIIEFSDMLHVKAQQNNARLRPHSVIKQMGGDLRAYDGLNQVDAREVFGRVQQTQFSDIEHTRRKIKRRRFEITLPVDKSDVRGMITNPEGDYASACNMAMQRQFDRVGVEAVFADVETGRDFETVVTFANDGGSTVDATAGLTYEKLLEIKKGFRNQDVATNKNETIAFAITGTEEEALMKELELTSGDFSRQFVVDDGEITKGVGMIFVIFGADVPLPILDVNTGTRDCIAFTNRGLCYGISKEAAIDIDDRKDFIETVQVQAIFELGAVRTEGVQVQKVQTTA